MHLIKVFNEVLPNKLEQSVNDFLSQTSGTIHNITFKGLDNQLYCIVHFSTPNTGDGDTSVKDHYNPEKYDKDNPENWADDLPF